MLVDDLPYMAKKISRVRQFVMSGPQLENIPWWGKYILRGKHTFSGGQKYIIKKQFRKL